MKTLTGMAISCILFGLTGTAFANRIEEKTTEALLPGTTIVPGDPKNHDFYIATEEQAPQIIKSLKPAKKEVKAKANNDQHTEEQKSSQYNPDDLATFDVDMNKLLDKYSTYENKVTLIPKSTAEPKEKAE